MNRTRPDELRWKGTAMLVGLMVFGMLAGRSSAQGGTYERTFAESKATVEKALKDLQPSLSGRLPVLDGFAQAGDYPLDRYQRPYFQTTVEVSATASGGSVVRVRAKVTAWYADPTPSRSGYQVLSSNGRLEGDLLDQLSTELRTRAAGAAAGRPPTPETTATAAPTPAKSPTKSPADSAPTAPMPRFPETSKTFPESVSQGLAAQQSGGTKPTVNPSVESDPGGLKAEADSLEEILKNQAHPKNLVAVKKSGTPVVATASLTAKTLFMASAHDEFEMLDFNADWVHVRISGLSRGWIWRTSLEMPEGIPDVDPGSGAAAAPTAADFFQVSREETAQFPGDWAPLRNKSVKIISVQQKDEAAKDIDPKVKLEYAKSLLDKSYKELSGKADLAGVVLIFDSADGGMIATTVSTLQQWKAGKLSDAALWHQSYFDPPESFDSTGPSASQ